MGAHFRHFLILFSALVLLLSIELCVYPSAVVFYLDDLGGLKAVMHPDVSDPVSAVAALAQPIVDPATGKQLSSAIPQGNKVLDLRVEGETTIVDFSKEVTAGITEEKLGIIFKQVNFTLRQFGLDKDVKIMAEGKLLSDYLPPAPTITPRLKEATPSSAPSIPPLVGGLAGKSITISPGHGIYWNGSGWYTQRPVYCSPLNEEDFHNLEMCQYLERYLLNDGATVRMVRCTNKNYGNHPTTGNPWWKMAACYWLQHIGYPCSVYGSYSGCTLGSGSSESSDDIRSRPLASDYDNSDIYVSLHTNGYAGDCYSGCPTGTETYYDASTEHAPWGAVSQTLATYINNNIMSAIQQNVDSQWTCHGACVKNSNGAYGEIRIPDRAATLTELAFHDSCNYDAVYLRDNFFRSAAMWGMYKGICQYFGTNPTWDFYSCELVSEDIPTTMEAGRQYTVHITFRNKGVLWTEARQIRLGAVGDSDPFTTQTRHIISGEVGPNETYTFTFVLTAPNSGNTYLTDWRMVRDGYTWFGPTVSKQILVIGEPDTQAPSVPANLVAEAVSTSQIELTWSASTDNVGVTGYKVFRNGSQIATTTQISYTDTGLAGNTTYTYTVSAYDAIGNESAQSAPSAAITHVVVFQDGFPNLNAWSPDVVADGSTRGVSLYTDEHHGTYSGSGAALTQPGSNSNQGCLSYRALQDTFSCGAFDCWFYDVGGTDNSNQGIHVRGYNGNTIVFSAYLGTYPTSPGSVMKYSGGVFDGSSWSWAPQLASRSIAWHNLKIVVGPTQIKYYIDGVKKGSLPRPANADTFGFTRVNIGREYNVVTESLFDDAQFTVSPPLPPIPGTPVALSTSSIRWNFTDVSNNESGFRLHDASHAVKGNAGRNASYIDETGLAPNTLYTRHFHARNGSVEGPGTSTVYTYTLSVPPSTSNVICDKATNTWYSTPSFTFTAVGGFGAGKVQYYRFAWNKNSTHTWTGVEPQWNYGDLTLTASEPGSWYLHIKGYNGANVENGTLDLGPFKYAPTVSTISDAKALPNDTPVSLANKVVTGNFGSFFYIQENGTPGSDQSAGIRVDGSGPAVGTLVTVSGVIKLQDGERRIAEANVIPGSAGIVPDAPFMINRCVGGGSLNTWTPGLPGRWDIHNIGLLIKTSGIISFVGSGFVYINDGSVQNDGTGHSGLRVETTNLTGPFNSGDYMIIRGVSSTMVDGGVLIPVVRPRNDGDKTIYSLP
ncbi:MAG: N-acetylmuramoyl-L-alanine amidase [Armatimonadetes bacterium]|nr:N-acetylmuramoyl-L-alanine amidase [Armatimonadota bacterium]